MVIAEKTCIHLYNRATAKQPGKGDFSLYIIPATFDLIYPPSGCVAKNLGECSGREASPLVQFRQPLQTGWR